jgi:NDP-sugar pyrophosphorylase family protein
VKALVLAAGKSTRIASVSGGLPKPLLTVGGRRVIERTLEWLAASGVREVWINLHHRADDVRNALGDGSSHGVRISYSYEPELLGTAGTFRSLASEWSETTLVVYGDNVISFDLERFAADHRAARSDVTIALFDQARHANSRIAGGRVVLDSHHAVTSFVEGGSDGLVNAGAYLLEPSVANVIAPGVQDFGRDILPVLAADGRVRGYVMEAEGFCLGLDTPESFSVAEELIGSGQLART